MTDLPHLFATLHAQVAARLNEIATARDRLDQEERQLRAYLAVLEGQAGGQAADGGRAARRRRTLDSAGPTARILAALAASRAGMTRMELMAETGLGASLGNALLHAKRAGRIHQVGRRYRLAEKSA